MPDSSDQDAVQAVWEVIVAGGTEADLQAVVPGRDPAPLIAAALGRLRQSAKQDQDILRGWAIEAGRLIYRRAMAGKRPKLETALKATRFLAGLAEVMPAPPPPKPADDDIEAILNR